MRYSYVHSLRARSPWRAVAERRGGVERDPFGDDVPRLAAVGVALEVDVFVFERAATYSENPLFSPGRLIGGIFTSNSAEGDALA